MLILLAILALVTTSIVVALLVGWAFSARSEWSKARRRHPASKVGRP